MFIAKKDSCDLDLRSLNSNQLILEFKWMFVSNLKKFPEGNSLLRYHVHKSMTSWGQPNT